MKLDKVFIGVTQDNNEVLLYKKDDCYYNLKTKKKVNLSELQENALVLYSDVIKCRSRWRKNIIRAYEEDRLEKISLQKVFIGHVAQVIKVKSSNVYEKSYGTKITYDTQIRKVKTALLLNLDDKELKFCNFLDIETGYIYDLFYPARVGKIFVRTKDRIWPFNEVVRTNEVCMEKGKILKKYRDVKKESTKKM